MATTSPSSAGVAPSDQERDAAPGGPGTTRLARGPRSLLRGLVQLARPRQWTKNLLVFAAPAAAGVLDNTEPAVDALIAFAAFCLAASGTYYVNDARDADADRLHPTKRTRPVASGAVPEGVAYAGGVVLLAASVALGLAASPELAATILGYAALTTAYSTVLKNVAVVDLVAVAAGFVLRAVAGAAATDVPISDWFFIVTSFGALFIVSGKRAAEASEMAAATADARRFRPVLGAYSESYMAYLRSVTSGAVLVAYCLWAFEKADSALSPSSIPWYQLSILPFVMAVLRYALVLDRGDRGSAPEDIILGDRTLQCIGVAWAIVFAAGVYTA
jgi:decaprenyl-phosphate phosphoribosyltransferase